MKRLQEIYSKLHKELLKLLKEYFKDNLLAVILFGSYLFRRDYKDIDVIVVVRECKNIIKEALKLRKIVGELYEFHIINIEDFEKIPYLEGLALGYVILYDKVNIEAKIRKIIEKVANKGRLLFMHGILIDLGKIAKTRIIFQQVR